MSHVDPARPADTDVPVPHLEPDETVPPRPEEEVADVARAEPGAQPGTQSATGPSDRSPA